MYSLSKKIVQKSINNSNTIYNIAYILAVLKAILAFSELIPRSIHSLNNIVFNGLIIVLIAYKLFVNQKYSVVQIIVLLITGFASIASDFELNRFMLIPDFLLLAATQDIDFKKNMKLVWKIEAFIIAIHVLVYPVLYALGRVEFTVRGYNYDNRIRHQFLLSHANVFSMLVLWTVLAYIYSNFERMDKKRIVICWLINVFFYLFTDSNSGMLILSFISILLILKEYVKDIAERIISFLSKYLFIILAIFFNTMMIIYPKLQTPGRMIWREIDSFFTGRLKYGAYIYDKYGFTLFGRFLSNKIRDYWQGFWIDGLPADNMYMFFSVWCGMFFLIVIAFMFWKYSDRATTEEKIIIIAYSLYTMMETYVTYVQLCFALILVVKYAWKDYSVKLPRKVDKRYPNEV